MQPPQPLPRRPPVGRWRRLVGRPLTWIIIGGATTLALVWGTAAWMARLEEESARRELQATGKMLVETYEAQVLRALREIDQALRVLAFAAESTPPKTLLGQLTERGLLPPAQLFGVFVLDQQGHILSSNGAQPSPEAGTELMVSGSGTQLHWPPKPMRGGERRLRFSRPLERAAPQAAREHPARLVALEVDVGLLVSNDDPALRGRGGRLALRTAEGRLLVARQGDLIVAGVPSTVAQLREAHWLYWERPLFDLPLQVAVGLDEQAQLAPARERGRGFFRLAGGASVLVLSLCALLTSQAQRLAAHRQQLDQARREREAHVEHLAFHDQLTGLPNRRLFVEELGQHVREALRYQTPLALLYIDLDGFKAVNDGQGHEAGDELLRQAAARFQACLRDSDVVARLGGDEFVVLLPRLDDAPQVEAVASKILAAIGRPFDLASGRCAVSASIGVALCPRDGRDAAGLLRAGDAAMYAAKQAGKNAVRHASATGHPAALPTAADGAVPARALQNE